MGSAYEHLSREELVALLTSRSEEGKALRAAPDPPASGDRYRQLVEHASDGIFISDASGTYLDVNEVGASLLGMSREEVIGKNIADVVVESERHVVSQLRSGLGIGEWMLREWRMRRKDGSTFIGEVSSKRLPDGRFQGICRDVTERREREEALHQSELRFRALTAASFEGIGISENGVIIDVNDQLLQLSGYERSELVGREVVMLIPAESREAVVAAIRSGRETPYRHQMVRKDGTRFDVEAQGRPTNWLGRPVRVTAVRDISAQLLLEERLHRVQRLEALGRLAGGIAHDFNNILVAIFSYTDLTDLDAEDPAQVRAHLDGLRAAALRARDLVQQILTFSRQKGDERVRTSVQPIVDEALRFLRSSLPSSIEVRAEIDAGAPDVLGAPVQIHQVIMNLCVNAAQAMQQSGVLSVRLSQAWVTPELSLRVPDLAASRAYLRLVVQDTGRGMDSATLSRIFEPFFTTK
ncbi:MAG TPA: PAS domain S-box protein, partial [Polyangiaceae bacterium]|nr:PAS domain S-box protein [Polyangiaceae bacterium]